MYYKKIFFVLFLFAKVNFSYSQDFITRLKVEFEKKVNLQNQISGNLSDEFRESIPKYLITNFDFIYSGGQSIYKFNSQNNNTENGNFSFTAPENSIFIDYTTKETFAKKHFLEKDFIIADSIKLVKWRITQETRNIAGYECRKAIGRIYDTVYVVAFYCEQMLMKAGPEGINGLPGMILGMAIPRYNTTWFATKVELAKINEAEITPPTKGNKVTVKELLDLYLKQIKDLGKKDAVDVWVKNYISGYLL